MTYEVIKRNYDRKLWNANMVAISVFKGFITPEDYKNLTGNDYVEPTNVPVSESEMAKDIKSLKEDITNTQIGLTEVYELLLGGTL